MAASFSEDLWKEAFSAVESQFEIQNLLPEQKIGIKGFFGKKNIFVNLPTGYGKSLIFQCLPIVSDVIHGRPRGSSILVVLSPLRSLMDDHVRYLGNIGIPAISIGDEDDEEVIQQVLNGNYIIVFGSPECFLSTVTWRGLFSVPSFREMLIGVVIDEAHCIVQWGLTGTKKVPFRKWYGCLGELNSLIPKDTKLMVLTATATKATKEQIMETLNLSSNDMLMIQQTPDRPNLFYSALYIDKNDPLEMVFGNLINEVEVMGSKTPRTLIYCQTRKQCSVLFRMFEVFLGKKLYDGESTQPQKRLVEMFHAGTPKQVKEHICENMTKDDGHLRVVICTVAFGMGINCRKVRRVIHFGPSKTVEQYIQECGRAGRDGLQSSCILLFNGLLSAFCDRDMKAYLQQEGCLRKSLMNHFESKVTSSCILHECCGFCAIQCKCNTADCKVLWTPSLKVKSKPPVQKLNPSSSHDRVKLTRAASEQDRRKLRFELQRFQQNMLKKVQVGTMVTCPNVLMEFNSFHINQVLEHCTSLFTVQDVVELVEVWRMQYAIGILQGLSNVFGDVNAEALRSSEVFAEISNYSDWSQVRDDTTLADMLNSQDLEDLSSFNTFMDTTDNSCASEESAGKSF